MPEPPSQHLAQTLVSTNNNYPPSISFSTAVAMRPARAPPRIDTAYGGTGTSHAPRRSTEQSPAPAAARLYDIPGSLGTTTLHPQPTNARSRPGGLAAMGMATRPGTTSVSASGSGGAGAAGSRSPTIRSPPPPETPSMYPVQTRPGWTRRGSEDTIVRPNMGRRGSDHGLTGPAWTQQARGRATPPPGGIARTAGGTSVYSGREGSVHGARTEGVISPNPHDLQNFAHHCRRFYFSPSPPEESATYISSALASLPPAHRAIYIRLQASMRSLAHLHHLRLRISSFHALISATVVSASLTPLSRSQLNSKQARLERRDKLSRFISIWGTNNPGVEPFFRGLWSCLRAQSRGDEGRGGAGSHRVVWELDDAVFLESGGAEFMHEAVIMLKGVLGFVDQPLTTPPKLRRIRTIPRSFSHARMGRSQPSLGSQDRTQGSGSFSRGLTSRLPPQQPQAEEILAPEIGTSISSGGPPPLPARNDPSLRSRATSDPFIDPRTGSPQKRSASGRGPAPPPPPSRRQVSGTLGAASGADAHAHTTTTSIPNPLQSSRTSSDIPSPLHAPEPSSNVTSPLLPEHVDPSDSVARVLEAAAQRSAQLDQRPRGGSNISDDRVMLLGRRTMSDDSDAAGLAFGRSPPAPGPENAIAEDDEDDDDDPTEDDIAAEETELNRPRYRLWVFPAHVTDEEAESLMRLFPLSVTRPRRDQPKDVRFPFVRPGRGIKDLESGAVTSAGWDSVVLAGEEVAKVPRTEMEAEEGVVRCGTGRMWVGLERRDTGWEGGGWFRFKRWWRRLFGRA